jgi:GTPase SAR1 family protein
LEAKREGTYFELPANPTQKLIVSIKSVMALDKTVATAIEQVQSYCSSRGTPLAIVCNGHQLIAFIAARQDGEAPFDGNCLVVDGYEQMQKVFPMLWQNLSPEGMKERRIIRLLTAGTDAWIPKKVSSYLLHYPSFRYKSDIQANLRNVAELLIEDIVRTPEVESQFYKECYCESGALAQDALISRQILRARYAALFSPTDQSPSMKSVKPQKDEIALTPEVMAEALAHRPIVLIGDVGVGKTSFLKHLMYVSAFEEFQRAVYVYIDLGSQAALDSDLKAFVMSEIESQLLRRYSVNVYEESFVKGVYHGELELFRKGIYGSLSNSNPQEYSRKLLEFLETKIKNRPEHLRHSIQHIVAGRNQQVVLMMDNADQRNLEIQQEAFVIAQNFSRTWTAVVFIAVRPQTFHQSKRAGTLAAYPQKIFSISPPRVDLVMEKRLRFALNMSEGRLPVERLQGVRLNLHGLTLFLRALISSLKTNTELVELLSNITGGNIREAIDLVTKFIGSPNVDAEKIISIMERRGNYLVPAHEFSKSALLGEYSHYHPTSSIAMNIFDVRIPDEREHFLVPMVLAYLNYDGAHRNREGFVDTKRLIGEMQNWGFTPQQVEVALRRATNKRLIETTERVTFDEDITGLIGDLPAAFRITTIGAYHLLRWAPSFGYLDAMVFDTPVFDTKVREELTKDPDSFEIAARYRRATLFRTYLNAVWHKSGLTAPYFDWIGLLPSGRTSFDRVAASVARHAPHN